MNQHLRFNESVAPFTSYQIGGTAKAVVSVFSLEGLKRALQIHQNYVVLGRGSKVLFSDNPFNGTVILMRQSAITPTSSGIYAEAGVSLVTLSRHYAANSLSGLEFAACIPASIGGAIKTNAGAHESDISSLIVYVDVLRGGIVKRLSAGECGFSYRNSKFLQSDIILGACLKSDLGNSEQIRKNRANYIKKRLESQPKGQSCGSVFKNPPSLSAGMLIDQCALKGLSQNGATVSQKHANFILNTNKATARDIFTLIRTIKSQVYLKKGIKLEEELIYIGDF